MQRQSDVPHVLRFGSFDLDAITGELRKHGLRIRLQGQPLQLLILLLQRPGAVVSRNEIRGTLWPSNETFVDFENSLNAAVGKLRQALGDSAESPRFIETVPRQGYRFISAIAEIKPSEPAAGAPLARAPSHHTHRGGTRRVLAITAVLALSVGVLSGLKFGWFRDGAWTARNGNLIRSLAVLPLENLSGDSGQDFLAESMTEALITDLGKIDSLRVISRTSAMQYRAPRKSLKQIARELNVDAVVEGAVLRSGERVRVTAQLIRAETDQHLWAESYEGDFEDVLSLESKLAKIIAGQIQLRLTSGQLSQLETADQVPPAAYEAYVKALGHLYQWSAAGTAAAIDYFQQAIELDPNFARAYAGLAECYIMWAPVPYEEAKRDAASAISKALELDPNLGEAHAVLAMIKFIYAWDWAGANAEFLQATRLDPGFGEAHHQYSHFLMQMGRISESYAESKRNLEIDPLSAHANLHLGWHYLYAGQYDDAVRQLRKTLQIEPHSAEAHEQLGQAYEKKQMFEEAISEFQKAVDLSGDSMYLAGFAHGYAASGKPTIAEALASQLKKKCATGDAGPLYLAFVYAGLGNRDQAFEWLERDFHPRDYFLAYLLRVNPFLDGLHSDPRFNRILTRMNLPLY